MRIAYLAAGAGDMYCGSCLHDNSLCASLIAEGEDVLLVPLYTPLRTDEMDVSQRRVFFGGINVFLQQRLSVFRHTPWWLDRWLDARWLLRGVSRRASVTDPAGLGDLTVSMLRGRDGRQSKELDKLCDWLAADVRPDVVHLSNTLLTGAARAIRERLGVPIICSLSGEDLFVEKLPQPDYDKVRELLSENCEGIDAFVAMNGYYAQFMADYLSVDRGRIEVIPHGVQLARYDRPSGGRRPRSRLAGDEVTIGFLARVCHDKGLHLLVDAVARLVGDGASPPVQLCAAGYLAKADRAYLAEVRQQAERAKIGDRFEYLGELDHQQKIEFLASLDVFSTPTVYPESKGLPAIEALASGVPVVLPAHGAFPELVGDTGGGLLCQPHDPASLATSLAQLLGDPAAATEHGRRGQQAVAERYAARTMARRTAALYRRLSGSATATGH